MSQKTFKLINGYDRKKNNRETHLFRHMTIDEAKQLDYGDHIYFVDAKNENQYRECKVNGKARTWKRNINRVEVPVKYGYYEYGTFYSIPEEGIIERIVVMVK
jgi:hypothetical protein